MDWKQRILEINTLLTTQRTCAFRVARQLKAVHDDPEFLASDEVAGDELRAIAYLDRFAVALFVVIPEERSPYLDLAAMLATNPKEEAWADGDLSAMYQAVLDRESERAADRPEASASRPSYKAKYEEAMESLRQAEARIRQLETELELYRRGELAAA